MSAGVISGLSAVATAAIAGLVAWLSSRRRDRAGATDVITTAAERLVQMHSADNQRLREEVQALTIEVRELRRQMRVDQLHCDQQLNALRLQLAEIIHKGDTQ